MPEKKGADNLLSQLVHQLPEAAFAVDQAQVVTAWNECMTALTGLDAADIIGQSVNVSIKNIYGNGIPLLVTLLTANETISAYSWMNLYQNQHGLQACFLAPALGGGRGALVQVNARLIRDRRNKITGAIEMVRVISAAFGHEEEAAINQQWQSAIEQLAALELELHRGNLELQYKEKSIRESERRFQDLLENIPLVAILIDHQAKLLFANDYCIQLFKKNRDEIIGRKLVSALAPPLNQTLIDHWISKTLANDSPRQGLVTMKDANGCLHRLSWISSLLYTPDGEVEGILVLGEDVTEREGAAKALQKQVAYLNTIIDNLSELFCTFDREFKVTFINKMSTEVIGYDANALTGKSLPNLLQITNREWDKIKPQLEIGASVSWEQTIHHRNGDIKVLRVNSAVLWEDDEILGGMLLGDDITDERRALTALTENESTLRQITDNMTDLISRLDPQGKVLYASPSHYSVLGYQLDELKQLTLKDLVHPDDLNNSIKALKMALRQGKTSRNQQRSRHANGSYIWTETVTNPLIENGKITGAIMSSRDITERKKLEDDLRFLSVHDPLTGLYNRTYFETEMERLDGGRYDPVGIVVCDLDGLKLVNDTLGHEAGDRLLISTAAVLKQCFRQSDVVSRVGGDEFAILLPGSQHDQLEMLVNRIYEGVAYYNFDNPDLPLSLSVGMAVRGSRTVSMRDAYKEADNEMYRVKLNRSKSARSAVVQTLMKALEARDYITEGHAERLQELAARMGRRLGLSDNTITSLQLLAQFHDIGKVGVPDRILFKPGLLTEEEYAEMKRHCEIGHRIALASQELSSLAELILKHHEWWDGKGYPSGLKGHDIPLECRILALADAYDAMTSNRPYRQGMEHSDALLEIEHHAGTQFDPVLAEIFVDMLWDDGARYDS